MSRRHRPRFSPDEQAERDLLARQLSIVLSIVKMEIAMHERYLPPPTTPHDRADPIAAHWLALKKAS